MTPLVDVPDYFFEVDIRGRGKGRRRIQEVASLGGNGLLKNGSVVDLVVGPSSRPKCPGGQSQVKIRSNVMVP